MCLHSYAQDSGINSWFSTIFFPSSQTHVRDEPPWFFPPLGIGVYQFAKLSTTKRQLWSGRFSAWLGGNMHLNGHSDNFHPLCAHLIPWSSRATKLVAKLAEKRWYTERRGTSLTVLGRSSRRRWTFSKFRKSLPEDRRSLEIVFIV